MIKRRIAKLSIVFFIMVAIATRAAAADLTPFYTVNQSPLISIFGLPPMGEVIVLPAGLKKIGVGIDLASNYINVVNGNEHLLLDGETTRFTLSGRYGIAKNWEVSLDVPFIIKGGGFLDDFIIKYHDTFGFPQGGRDQAPLNRLLYQYTVNGTDKLKITSSGEGIGDIRLGAAWQLYRTADSRQAVALKTALKLPTGNSNELFGSGSTDLALWLAATSTHSLHSVSPMQFGLWGGAGLMGMTRGKVLPEQQRNFVGFGNFGMGLSLASWIALKIQLDAHTSFYDNSSLREINGSSVQITMGGTLAFPNRINLDIGVTEDIIVATSPDVVFHLRLSRLF